MESDSDRPVAASRWVAEFVSGPDDGRRFTFYTARVGNVGAAVSRLSTRSDDRSRDVSRLITLISLGKPDCSEVADRMVDLVGRSVVRESVAVSWRDLPDDPHDIVMLNQAIGMVRGFGAAAACRGP